MSKTWLNYWGVAGVDFAITYPYAFAANTLPFERSGVSAPWTYWVAQPWVYGLIAPVAIVAAWRGIRQFQALQRAQYRWWRLPGEAALFGAFPVIVIAIAERAAVFRAIAEAALLAAGLGIVVSLANVGLFRLLRVYHLTGGASESRPAA